MIPQDFIDVMQSINIYRWIFLENTPWLLSIRSSNYFPTQNLQLANVDPSKCTGQSGIIPTPSKNERYEGIKYDTSGNDHANIENNLPQLRTLDPNGGRNWGNHTNGSSHESLTIISRKDTDERRNLNEIKSKDARPQATRDGIFSNIQQLSNPSTVFLSQDHSKSSQIQIGMRDTQDISMKGNCIELQLVFTNNQDLIYSSTMNYEALCCHRQDTYSHSNTPWKDYFAVIQDSSSILTINQKDKDVWSIQFRGNSTNISVQNEGFEKLQQGTSNLESTSVTPMHIQFQYDVCRLVDEHMRRDAMQYLLFALVGLIETQQNVIQELRSSNHSLQKANTTLRKLNIHHQESDSQPDPPNSVPFAKSDKPFLNVNLNKPKRKRPPELFKKIKKVRGAIIT